MTRQRRAAGEGGISPVKNADGKIIGYEGSVEIKNTLGGKRRRRKVRGKTKTEVSQKIKTLQKEQDQGVDIGSPQQTIKQYLEHWLESVVKRKNEPKTYHGYEGEVRNHIVPFIGHIRLDMLTQKHVEGLRDTLEQLPQIQRPDRLLGTRAVEYAIDVLSRALNKAVDSGLIARNVAARVQVKKSTPKRRVLTLEQAQAFLAVIVSHRLEALFTTLLLTGLRRGEALALLWSDINFEQREISITKSFDRLPTGRHVGSTKTDEDRTVAIPGVLVSLFKRHHERQEAERLQDTWQEHNLVFPSERGTPLEPTNMRRTFKAMLLKAGLPADTTIHSLRHTCATLLLDQGENVTNVAAQLGHKKTSTTMDIYSHAVRTSQAKGIDQLGKKLKGEEE